MPTTVDFPAIVNQALELFGDIFDNEPARRHFAEYLTGLMVAERKNISAINRQFATTTDQSCLNRWLVEAAWDAAALNDRRLAWLQDNPKTRYRPHGVIAIDNTPVSEHGAGSGRPQRQAHRGRGLVVGPYPSAPQPALNLIQGHRPRLPDIELRLSLRQPLSN
jgi:hypothetical protein